MTPFVPAVPSVASGAAISVPAGWWALLAAVAVTLGIGLTARARDGRVRGNTTASGGVGSAVVDSRPWGEELPESLRRHLAEAHAGHDGDGHGNEIRVTLLQLSTTFCAPCRHTRILLSGLAEKTPGLRHVEVDLTHHPEWSNPLGVHRTPTTIALDAAGRELFRVGGVPRRDELSTTLHPHLDDAA